MSGIVNNALNRFISIVVLLCMTGNDSNQSPRMYFVLLGITFLVSKGDPVRGRVVVDVVAVPGV